ncbi:MAG TPA: MlaD family protein [Verrucomicrobiae bacterium]|jgi:ABC-type transporter Mla subunit MlaD|nr:MlaD family protein [Verrucomicrobiae bacterium]
MALQDLTPQLRTRLSRMERAVGWFVFLATALLIFGFGYYVYHTAERKGWFKIKAPFFTYVKSSEGLHINDPVVMMGFQVGQITLIHAMPPGDKYNVRVEFEITDPYFRYIQTSGSYLKVNSADFLGKRELEVTRGTNGVGSYEVVVTQPISIMSLDDAKKAAAESPGHWQLAQDVLDEKSNVVFYAYDHAEKVLDESNATLLAQCATSLESNSIYVYDNTEKDKNEIVASWWRKRHRYQNFTPNSDDAYLHAVETPPISDQVQAMVLQVQSALPNFLALTNKLDAVLDNAANATSNLNVTLVTVHPMLTNFADISAQLREPGGVATWALGTNGDDQIQGSLTNLDALLNHLADITSNLNAQVQGNTNFLGGISKTIGDTDDFIQGLKRHWLLRSAFKVKSTNAPAKK